MRRTTVVAAACAAGVLTSPVTIAAAHGPQPTAKGAPGVLDPLTKLLAPKILPTSGDPADDGRFGPPFVEPTLAGRTTDAKCIDGAGPDGLKQCKPAAGTNVLLPGGRIVYWNNLGGTENVRFSIVGEYGAVATNDEARVLDLGKANTSPTWKQPTPVDGGADPDGERDPDGPLIPGGESTETFNDGALFGSHQSFLPDGRLLIQGGTDYSLDPGVTGVPFGVVELSGLKATRIFDPRTNEFTQTGSTAKGRWYPTQISLGDSDVITFGGVRKLLKPIYRDTPTESLQNELTAERYDVADGTWKDEGAKARKDLPLYPRLHLLPNGKVFYNAAGQAFNPFGQSLGELSWMNAAVYDPDARSWRDLGVPGVTDAERGTTPSIDGGFRGSTTSTMLPLEPNADGEYEKASFLTAGGVLLPSPGSYLAVRDSRITTVRTGGGTERMSTRRVGSFSQPRWFSSNVLTPTGEIVAFNGGDKDEVVGPGTEFPVQQTEIFDPKTEKWHPAATAGRARTYHNTAVLLPSGEILVGGHATISTLYLNNTTLPGGFAPHDGRDPSFEIYKPPYLFRGERPKIARVAKTITNGSTFGVRLAKGTRAKDITSVRLVRNTAVTHLVDADQRQVVLPVVARKADAAKGDLLMVRAAPDGDVAPPGPYMLFANRESGKGDVPSVAAELTVRNP